MTVHRLAVAVWLASALLGLMPPARAELNRAEIDLTDIPSSTASQAFHICSSATDSDPLRIPRLPQSDEAVAEVASLPELPGDFQQPPQPVYFEDPTALPWQRSPITAVAYSPDDRTIVTGSAEGLLQLWTADGEPVGFPFGTGEAAYVELVGFSPDGATIITGDRRGWLRQWSRSGRLLSEVDTQEHEYAAIAWDQSPDRTQVAVGSLRGDLQVWNVSGSRSRLLARTDLQDSPYAIAYSPTDNGLIGDIAVGMRQGEVRFLTPQLTPSRADLTIVAETVVGLSWYPGTRILAVRDNQGVIRVVDATDRPFTPALTDMSRPSGRPPFGYSPTGQLVSLASAIDWRLDPVLTGWNLRQQVINAPIQRSYPTALGFDSAGTLAVGNGDCTLRLWDSDLQPVALPFSLPHSEVALVAISGAEDGRFVQWSIVTDPDQRGPLGEPIPSAYRINQWTPTGKLLSSASLANTLAIRDAAFDIAGQQFITLGLYGTVKRWGFDGALLGEFDIDGQTRAMALYPAGAPAGGAREGRVAIAADDGVPTVQLWTVAGQYLWTLLTLSDRDRITTLAFDPQGEMIAVGIDVFTDDWKEQLLLLPLSGERRTPPIDLNQAGHYTLTFSPDGSLLAAGDSDGVISIWTRTGTLVSEVSLFDAAEDNGPRIFSLAFSPDNRLLASLDSDEAVRLWQTDGTHLGNLWPDANTRPSDVRFTPDGQALLIGSEQGIHRWWLPTNTVVPSTYPVPPISPLVMRSPFAPPSHPLDRELSEPTPALPDRSNGNAPTDSYPSDSYPSDSGAPTSPSGPAPSNDNLLPPLD